MREKQQGAIFGAHQCGTGDSREVSFFTLLQSVEKSIANGLASKKTTHGEKGHWCSGHVRRERVTSSTFYMRSNAKRVRVKTYKARPTLMR